MGNHGEDLVITVLKVPAMHSEAAFTVRLSGAGGGSSYVSLSNAAARQLFIALANWIADPYPEITNEQRLEAASRYAKLAERYPHGSVEQRNALARASVLRARAAKQDCGSDNEN